MKKIIIIEDTKDQYEKLKNQFLNDVIVDVSNEISSIFDINLKKFIITTDYDFVIIHNSFKQSNVSSEIISELKNHVNENKPYQLITYSGGIKITQLINSFDQLHFYIQRKVIIENIGNFVDFSKLIGKWYLPALLYKDYKRRFLKASQNQLKRNFNYEIAQNCLIVLGYNNYTITDYNREVVLEQINNKINE